MLINFIKMYTIICNKINKYEISIQLELMRFENDDCDAKVRLLMAFSSILIATNYPLLGFEL